MNSQIRNVLIIIVVIIGAIAGWAIFKALIGIVLMLGMFIIFWAGFKVGQFFPRKPKEKKQ